MNIGLDIDNVISDFDRVTFPLFLKEDKKKRNAGIVDAKAHYMGGMFDWSKEEVEEFLVATCEENARFLPLRKNAKKYIDLLLKQGHNIILISHRAFPTFKNPREVTVNWLKNKKINYTKLILSESADKTQECVENAVDVMFDDRYNQVVKMLQKGVNCVMVLTKYNRQNKNLPFVSSFKGIYDYVSKLNKN